MKRSTGFAAAMAVIAATMLAGCPQTPATHTQNYTAGNNDLEGKQLYFMPTPSVDFYQRVVTGGVNSLNNPTDNATTANLAGGAEAIDLGVENAIFFYGKLYETIYIGANGTIGFGAPGNNSSLTTHFTMPEVSLLPVDTTNAVGTVTYEIVDGEHVAVTYDGVSAGGEMAIAQAQFYVVESTDGGNDPDYGDIVLSYLKMSPDATGVVGLSAGQLMGANQAQIAAFMSDFSSQRGAILTTDVMTGTVMSAG